jgi:four helix bundle protein
MLRNYRDLIAWQKAMDLVELAYVLTKKFPKEEIYGLVAQLRRAAVSVPSNIAEGQGRGSAKEFSYFLAIAHGSLRELETQMLIAQRLTYIDGQQADRFLNLSSEVGRLIIGLKKSLKT